MYKLCKVFFTSYGINFTTYMKAIYKYNTIFYTEIVDKDNENLKGKGKKMKVVSSKLIEQDRKSTRLNSSHLEQSRMPSSA